MTYRSENGAIYASVLNLDEWLRLEDEFPTFVAIRDLMAIEVTERGDTGRVKVTVVLRNGQTANGWISESLLG